MQGVFVGTVCIRDSLACHQRLAVRTISGGNGDRTMFHIILLQLVDAKHDFIKVACTHGVFDIIVHFLLHRAVKPCQPICLVNKDACQRADDKDNDMFQR